MKIKSCVCFDGTVKSSHVGHERKLGSSTPLSSPDNIASRGLQGPGGLPDAEAAQLRVADAPVHCQLRHRLPVHQQVAEHVVQSRPAVAHVVHRQQRVAGSVARPEQAPARLVVPVQQAVARSAVRVQQAVRDVAACVLLAVPRVAACVVLVAVHSVVHSVVHVLEVVDVPQPVVRAVVVVHLPSHHLQNQEHMSITRNNCCKYIHK